MKMKPMENRDQSGIGFEVVTTEGILDICHEMGILAVADNADGILSGRAGIRSQSCEVADGRKPTGLPAPDGLHRTAKRRSCSYAAT